MVAAYLGAIAKSYPQLQVSQALIIVALPDQPAEVWEFDRESMLKYWDQWLARLEAFQNLRSHNA